MGIVLLEARGRGAAAGRGGSSNVNSDLNGAAGGILRRGHYAPATPGCPTSRIPHGGRKTGPIRQQTIEAAGFIPGAPKSRLPGSRAGDTLAETAAAGEETAMPDAALEGRPTIAPSGAALAADVADIDLAQPLDDATFARIERAWMDHLVLRFRGQTLDDDQLMRFSARFGPLDRAPVQAAGVTEARTNEWVTIISNVKVDGKPIGGLGNYESLWHTDMSYNDAPPIASLLHAREVPARGGDTGFANMYRAYETLADDIKARIQKLSCKHDSSRNSVGELRRGFKEVADPRDAPGAVHPIVRTHPATKRKCLFLGRRRNANVVGLDLADSEALLDLLWAHATRPENCWFQQWRVGDLVLWDNRCAMHRRDAFDDGARRVMHRTQVQGDRPY
jgi:taurine dioxygenase